MFRIRMKELGVQAGFIAEEKQSLGIGIQSTQRVDVFWETELRQSAVGGAVGRETGKNSVGLVKGQEHGRKYRGGVARPRELLQNGLMEINLISPAQAEARRAKGEALVFVDVRSPAEFQSIHATGARLFPLDELQPQKIASELGISERQPVVLLCAGGNRARKAAEKFLAEGIPHCLVVEGGTKAWEASGLPVVRGQGMISIERQVRIGAGAMVLLGVVLGSWVDPFWFFLSGFVGAGLIFAGITDWCGMGMLLAKMPWNQAKPAACQLKK